MTDSMGFARAFVSKIRRKAKAYAMRNEPHVISALDRYNSNGASSTPEVREWEGRRDAHALSQAQRERERSAWEEENYRRMINCEEIMEEAPEPIPDFDEPRPEVDFTPMTLAMYWNLFNTSEGLTEANEITKDFFVLPTGIPSEEQIAQDLDQAGCAIWAGLDDQNGRREIISGPLAVWTVKEIVLEHRTGGVDYKAEIEEINLCITAEGKVYCYNPNLPDHNYEHPHVDNRHICLGEASASLPQLINNGQLVIAFMQLESIMRTYNSASPHYRLEKWDWVACPSCGRVGAPNNLTLVGDEVACTQCTGECRSCEQHCNKRCRRCEVWICEEHTSRCVREGWPLCFVCAHEQKCKSCNNITFRGLVKRCNKCRTYMCQYCANMGCQNCAREEKAKKAKTIALRLSIKERYAAREANENPYGDIVTEASEPVTPF